MQFDPNQVIRLKVIDREEEIFDEDVAAISSTNAKGPFDILPQHANFITLIRDYIRVHRHDADPQLIKVDNGVLRYRNGTAEVYIGVLSPEADESESEES